MEKVKFSEYFKNLNSKDVTRALLVTVSDEGRIQIRFDNFRKEDFALVAAHLLKLATRD